MTKSKRNDFCQEIFWKMKDHLIEQNEKCQERFGKCRLRYKNLKCAAGVLIPDLDYFPNLENLNFYIFFTDSGYLSNELRLIEDVQLIHDYEEVDNWSMRLKEVANVWGLQYDKT